MVWPFVGSPCWARTSDNLHIAYAVLGVKPWEYFHLFCNSEGLAHTLRTVALSQSVSLSGTLSVKLLSMVRVLSIPLVLE